MVLARRPMFSRKPLEDKAPADVAKRQRDTITSNLVRTLFLSEHEPGTLCSIVPDFWGKVTWSTDKANFDMMADYFKQHGSLDKIRYISTYYDQGFVDLPGICPCFTSLFDAPHSCIRLLAKYALEVDVPERRKCMLYIEITALKTSKWRANSLLGNNPELFSVPAERTESRFIL